MRSYKEFKVGDIFKIEYFKNSKAPTRNENGKNPYIGASHRNNGLQYFSDEETYVIKGNCIVFICTGQGSVGYSIYKAENFIGSANLKLGRIKKLNKFNAQFLVTALNQNKNIYSYGYIRKTQRLKNEKILLPVTPEGEPDFAYMEEFIKDKEELKYKKYLNILEKRLRNLEFKEILSLEELSWREFFIEDICEIKGGKNISKNQMQVGKTPYILAKAGNNAVNDFVSNNNSSLEKNCLSLNANGSVGYCFYHPYEAQFFNDCRKLILKNKTHHLAHFIANQITMQKDKYNYGYKMGTQRIKRQKILLPVTPEGKPYFAYMEQYIKNLEFKKYNAYKRYLLKKFDLQA